MSVHEHQQCPHRTGGLCPSCAKRDPYRPAALAVAPRQAKVEAAACQWCRWSDAADPYQCDHPVVGGGARPFCHRVNPRGECPHFSPSWLTRLLRRFGGRAPAMVDPRVWDGKP